MYLGHTAALQLVYHCEGCKQSTTGLRTATVKGSMLTYIMTKPKTTQNDDE